MISSYPTRAFWIGNVDFSAGVFVDRERLIWSANDSEETQWQKYVDFCSTGLSEHLDVIAFHLFHPLLLISWCTMKILCQDFYKKRTEKCSPQVSTNHQRSFNLSNHPELHYFCYWGRNTSSENLEINGLPRFLNRISREKRGVHKWIFQREQLKSRWWFGLQAYVDIILKVA